MDIVLKAVVLMSLREAFGPEEVAALRFLEVNRVVIDLEDKGLCVQFLNKKAEDDSHNE